MIKRFAYLVWSKFLTFFGDIKVFKFPFWMVYDPSFFEMTGERILEAMEILQHGDVVLRGYNHYLDGYFINGDYSHGALYVGDNTIIHAVAPSVEKINVVEFMECDRIAIYRPKKYKAEAVRNAKRFLKEKRPYDFKFDPSENGGDEELFCFELVAKSFPKADIKTYTIRKILGLVKKEVYLAKSFEESPFFERVFEFNPQKEVDFRK